MRAVSRGLVPAGPALAAVLTRPCCKAMTGSSPGAGSARTPRQTRTSMTDRIELLQPTRDGGGGARRRPGTVGAVLSGGQRQLGRGGARRRPGGDARQWHSTVGTALAGGWGLRGRRRTCSGPREMRGGAGHGRWRGGAVVFFLRSDGEEIENKIAN